MPATSQHQQKAAGMALAAKRGAVPKAKLSGAARQMFDSMSEEELEHFAGTSRRKLPAKKGNRK